MPRELKKRGEGLRLARLLMVLSSLAPLFLLMGIRGNSLLLSGLAIRYIWKNVNEYRVQLKYRSDHGIRRREGDRRRYGVRRGAGGRRCEIGAAVDGSSDAGKFGISWRRSWCVRARRNMAVPSIWLSVPVGLRTPQFAIFTMQRTYPLTMPVYPIPATEDFAGAFPAGTDHPGDHDREE